MKHNDDILEFLSQPENIPLVFEVERQFKPLLDHFYNLFAELVLVDLKNRLEGNKLWGKWELIQGNIRDSDASYATVYIDLKKGRWSSFDPNAQAKAKIRKGFSGDFMALHESPSYLG